MKKQISNWTTAIMLVILICAIVYLTLLQGLPAGGGIEKQNKGAMKIGSNIWPGLGPFYIAKEKGFFKKNGVDVELLIFDFTSLKSIMMSDQVDGCAATPDMVQLHADKNILSVAVMPMDYSNGADGIITADKDIKEIKDLRGKEIAFEKGSISNFFLLYLLKKANMTEEDIKPVDMSSPDAASAFATGKVDTAVTWEPELSTLAKKRAGSHILITTRETPKLIPSFLIFRKEVLRERPEEVKGVLRGWYEALEYMEKNPDEANEIMAKSFGLTVQEFQEMKSSASWFNYSEGKEFFGTKDKPGQIYDIMEFTGDMWMDEGLIKKKANASEVIDPHYLEGLYN